MDVGCVALVSVLFFVREIPVVTVSAFPFLLPRICFVCSRKQDRRDNISRFVFPRVLTFIPPRSPKKKREPPNLTLTVTSKKGVKEPPFGGIEISTVVTAFCSWGDRYFVVVRDVSGKSIILVRNDDNLWQDLGPHFPEHSQVIIRLDCVNLRVLLETTDQFFLPLESIA